ncbi:histone-lysine N-methyltransferase family member SUVH2-like [Tasmannia lanceolata]|uniref:histone-lysine N-methyltransferase family member SUVH2-like n=1 Tax=Tasmannia lanceolata TaxID=3420 RepID=UPI004062E0E3
MDSSIPFQDLNLLPDPIFISPKIEPKTEPQDYPSFLQNPNPNPNPNEHLSFLQIPNPNPNSLQQITTVPQLSAAESDVYAEFLRISQLFQAAFAKKMRRFKDLTVLPSDSLAVVPSARSETSIVVSKQKRDRSAEMVRVSTLAIHEQRHFRDLVRKTRMVYESLRICMIQEEVRGVAKRMRADLKAAAAMMDRGMWLNRDKRIIGTIPGVYVGDMFFFRMEMCVIGLHGQVQAGIDYVSASRTSTKEPIATSIIVSGGYEDDEDSGDVIIYTGHGGRGRNLMSHCVHQKLEGGNLALERSRHYGIEVRVIRGLKSDQSPTGKAYFYDGLYKIVEYWFDKGKSGFGVYKYKIVRIDGQPEMGSVIFKYAESLKKSLLSTRPASYLSLDISKGKEKLPVYLFNDIDCDQTPMFFDYLVSPVYPHFVFDHVGNGSRGHGCDCMSSCVSGCYCFERNGGDLVYDENGTLLKGKQLIYECGSSCRCPPNCHNRVSQKGIRNRLEVFRSRETGWGVRSLDLIRAGSFICEFTGIMVTRHQAELISMNGDNLIYPDRFPERWVEWGDISDVFPGHVRSTFPALPELNYAMDVSRMRNVACYISHSCRPNVLVQFVLYDHFNVLYPHLMLFAMENIPPLRELSIDYGVADE